MTTENKTYGLTDFIEGMQYTTFDNVTALDLESIYNAMYVIASDEEMKEILSTYDVDTIDGLHDVTTVFIDVNLHSCFDNLTDLSSDFNVIKDIYFSRYGTCIDAYYLQNDNAFMLIIENR